MSADVPAVIVDCLILLVISYAHGVEAAGDRFAESGSPFNKGFFYCAFADASVVEGEYAVFSVDDGCDRVHFRIYIRYALRLNYCLRIGREIIPDSGEGILQERDFVRFDRSACVAFNAALAVALGQIAGEELLD